MLRAVLLQFNTASKQWWELSINTFSTIFFGVKRVAPSQFACAL